ncbi:MAG: adenylate/guanylate cyclase domain-containing protein, partial [Ilumatobacteraceae bacterium]
RNPGRRLVSKKRSTGVRRRLSVALVGVAFVSVVLLAAVIYVFARILINDGVEDQLESVRDTRVQALETGIQRAQAQVSTMAATPSVVDALIDLSGEFDQLDEDISADETAGLTDLYDDEVLPPFVAAGADVAATDLIPGSPAGRYVQQRYIAENPAGFDERDQLDDAGDGSGYSAAHAEYHPLLRDLLANVGFSDLLLVDADGDVVYSTKKRIDLGTNGLDGPYADVGLGRVLDRLSAVAVGDTVVSDTFFYVPTAGEPVFFLAAAVRSGSEVVGAFVTEVPVEALTAFMTAREDWQVLGLGKTGESYIVGADRTLRSDSRAWLEDPDDYLRRYLDRYDDEAGARVIETVGSPVLVQEVDNAAVTAGLDGDAFTGTVTNYLGTKTVAASGPVQLGGLNWAVVVEIDTDESNSALDSLLRRMLLVLAVLIPAIALIGLYLARVLTRPVNSLVVAADGIADGDLDTEVPDLGQNELGDLGRQLEGVANQLEAREQAIVDEEQHIDDILRALLPARLIDRVRRGETAIEDIFDTATVVSITVDGTPEAGGADQDLALEVNDRLEQEVRALIDRFGVERIQRSSGSQLYLTGLEQDGAHVAEATDFTFAVMEAIAEVSTEFGQQMIARAGISAGDVATGVLGSNQLAFSVWGDPPGTAVTLGSLARPGQVLGDGTVAEQLGRDWDLDPIEELPGLDDDIDAHVVNGRVGSSATASPDADS